MPGYYGPFAPQIQTYSCAASPMWIANSFVCLTLPDDHPFWTSRESNGVWEAAGSGKAADPGCGTIPGASAVPGRTVSAVLPGPGIAVDSHLSTGITELRTAKVLMEKNYSSRNAYLRLAFNSQFPWEDFDGQGAEGHAVQPDKGPGRPLPGAQHPHVRG